MNHQNTVKQAFINTLPVMAGYIVLGMGFGILMRNAGYGVLWAFSMSFYSLIVSVGRQLVVLIPTAFILSKFGNLHLVWAAFPIAEMVSFLISLFLFRKLYKARVEPLPEA